MSLIKIVETAGDLPASAAAYRDRFKDVTQVIELYGDHVGFSARTYCDYFCTLIDAGAATAIGRAILAAIETSTEAPCIHIIPVWHGNTAQFDPDVPAVIFDFLNDDTYFPQPAAESGSEMVKLSDTVLLFHELGHAVQWLTRRDWFLSNRAKNGVYEEIERDNLVRHEWLLCKELGLPARIFYDDAFAGKSNAIKRWNDLTSAATCIQRAWRKKKAWQAQIATVATAPALPAAAAPPQPQAALPPPPSQHMWQRGRRWQSATPSRGGNGI